MKAITLTQPWATLVAIGVKTIETRSWFTNHVGELAIHAAKTFPRSAQELCLISPFFDYLRIYLPFAEWWKNDSRISTISEALPLGKVVAVCQLVSIIHTDVIYPSEPEKSFGDYSPGRYAWQLSNVRPFENPVPAKGSLGLWEWNQ